MLAQEIVTAVQEQIKLTIILIDNHGYGSIGALSRSLGGKGFGTRYLFRDEQSGVLPDDQIHPSGAMERYLPVDLAANAASLGAVVLRANTIADFKKALAEAKQQTQTTVIAVETDRYAGVPGYESWWDVPVAEVSEIESVQEARAAYEENRQREQYYL
jgi:3D-(3,5/4)-trihydroxycyclohexane-1,2-dione acylhydrolase (decyclizing)